MNKKQVQQKVLQNGKPLALSKFTWCEKTMTFSSDEDNLVFAFQNIEGVKIISRDWSIQTAGYNSTQTAGGSSTQKAGESSTQTAGDNSTQTAGGSSTQTAEGWSTQTAEHNSTQTAEGWSTQTAGSGSTQTAEHNSTQTAGHNSTQTAEGSSTQTAGSGSTQTAEGWSTQTAGSGSTQTAEGWSTQTAEGWSTQTAEGSSTQTAGSGSTQTAGDNSTQKAGGSSTQTAEGWSTQTAGSGSTQTAGYNSTQKAGESSTQTAGYNSTQKAGGSSTHFIDDRCQVATGYESIIHVNGNDCAIINRNVFELIQPKSGDIIQISPDNIGGHLVNGIHSITGKKSIIADGILSEVISKKGNVYKVINHGKTKPSYLIESEVNDKKVYSHGKTLKEARESLIYKLSDRDSSQYKDLTLDSVLSKEEAIKCYMTITGACISGTKYFVDRLKDDRKELSVEEIINLTQGQYGHDKFKDFFNNT